MPRKPAANVDSSHITPAPRGRGRPADPELRGRLLQSARDQFGEFGLDGTSMDRVAAAAGVSKVTLYAHFSSKEALFNATVTEPLRATLAPQLDGLDPRKPSIALSQFAAAYVAQVMDDAVVGHMRALSASEARSAGLGEAFFRTGPMSVSAALVSYLKKAAAAGALKLADPSLAAELFMAMLRGHEQTRALIGVRPARGTRARAAYVALCVETFVRGFGGKDIA
jgi:TetR/AcrR family transcriptional repressor of mexJK operon